MTTVTLAELFKDTSYKLNQFKPEQIKTLESAISIKDVGKKPAPYVTCFVRGKPVKLTPEEAILQPGRVSNAHLLILPTW
jgi:type I restriction enzyme M protein